MKIVRLKLNFRNAEPGTVIFGNCEPITQKKLRNSNKKEIELKFDTHDNISLKKTEPKFFIAFCTMLPLHRKLN